MRIQYHCMASYENAELIGLLEKAYVKKQPFSDRKYVFDVYSDNDFCEAILVQVREKEERPFISESAEYCEEERRAAQWLELRTPRLHVTTSNDDFTFNFSCPYEHSLGDIRYRHSRQVNPYTTSSVPKWKPKYNFCADGCGDFSKMF